MVKIQGGGEELISFLGPCRGELLQRGDLFKVLNQLADLALTYIFTYSHNNLGKLFNGVGGGGEINRDECLEKCCSYTSWAYLRGSLHHNIDSNVRLILH